MQRKSKLALLLLLLVPCWVVAFRGELDLSAVHSVAKIAFEGHLESLYGHPAPDFPGAWYASPLALVFLKPLGALSLLSLKWIWLALQTIAFAVFWMCLAQLYPALKSSTLRWGWLLVWAVSINPIHGNFQVSHVLLMVTAVLLLAERLIQENNPIPEVLGGMLAALAGSVCLFPLFVAAYYFVARPRAVRQGVLLGLVVSVALPFLVFGATDASALFELFGKSLVSLTPAATAPEVLSLPSMLARWMTTSGEVAGRSVLATIRVITFAIGGLFLIFAYQASRAKFLRVERSDTHWWALALALCALLNPSTRPYHFLLFVPAFCSLLEFAHQRLSSALLGGATVVSAILIAFTTEGLWGKQINNALEQKNIPTLGILILCLALAIGLARRRVLYVR